MSDQRTGKPSWAELDRMYSDACALLAQQEAASTALEAEHATLREAAECAARDVGMGLAFMREAGTDPDAWFQSAFDGLRAALSPQEPTR